MPARVARLQRKIGEALGRLSVDDPQRQPLVRLSGRLSMLQAGANNEQAGRQLDAFEKAFADISRTEGDDR